MAVDLYYMPGGSTSRAVQLVAKAVGVELNLIELDLMKKEQLKPEFVKINPQHTVPTIVDNGFPLWESRAILAYLVNKYAKDDTLYPKDPQTRALVDQRLYFDMGTLYTRFGEYFYPLYTQTGPADPAKLEKVNDALKFLDTFLEDLEWAAGPNITIADIALVTTVSTIESVQIDLTQHSNVSRWLTNCKENILGYEEINQKQLDIFKDKIDEILNRK